MNRKQRRGLVTDRGPVAAHLVTARSAVATSHVPAQCRLAGVAAAAVAAAQSRLLRRRRLQRRVRGGGVLLQQLLRAERQQTQPAQVDLLGGRSGGGGGSWLRRVRRFVCLRGAARAGSAAAVPGLIHAARYPGTSRISNIYRCSHKHGMHHIPLTGITLEPEAEFQNR